MYGVGKVLAMRRWHRDDGTKVPRSKGDVKAESAGLHGWRGGSRIAHHGGDPAMPSRHGHNGGDEGGLGAHAAWLRGLFGGQGRGGAHGDGGVFTGGGG